MLQFYFLSIACNFLAGMSLSSDWLAKKSPRFQPAAVSLSTRTAKLVLGIAALCVGFCKLFVPVEGPLIIGDLFPAAAGMAMGIALLFEVFRQDAVLPAEKAETHDRPAPRTFPYRATLGMIGVAAAILHFFLPEWPFL